MTRRLDRIVRLREVAAGVASAAFVEARGRAAQHRALADRIAQAAEATAPGIGQSEALALAARLELGSRMRDAGAVSAERAADAEAAALKQQGARKSAQAALDAARDMRVAKRRAAALRQEIKDSTWS